MTTQTLIALNQSILTLGLIGIPTIISIFFNPTGNLLFNIGIVYIFGTPILMRLIVYTTKKITRGLTICHIK